MALVRYNPWRELNALQRQLDNIFDDVILPTANRLDIPTFPAIELTENEDSFLLKVEVPGINKSDLDIQATADSISIRGERLDKTKSDTQENTRSEFRYGKFHRVISLSKKIQNTNISAEYKDGILHLTLPKKEDEKNKVVQISLDNTAV